MVGQATMRVLVLLSAAAATLAVATAANENPTTPQPTAGPAPADTHVSPVSEATLLGPTLGRPTFVAPGGTLRMSALIPRSQRRPVFALVSSTVPRHRHLLPAGPQAVESLASGTALDVTVPAFVPPGTYDLEVRWGASCVVGRHCVAVGHLPERIRIVHLSNMNVGDVGAPDFDARLIDEVNLVSPTLIVATGDYLDATHTDVARGWLQLADFLSRFEAPTLLACGDHDDIGLYSRVVAPSPIGAVELGGWRGIVLLDHADNPIEQDAQQLGWVERMLSAPNDNRLTFVVSHAEAPSLLRYWQGQGRLGQMMAATRLGLWFAGGHRDWDGEEWAGLIAAAAPMLFVRTHQASTAAQDGAEGISHYRVVDLVGPRVFLPGDPPGAGIPPSIPVGRLQVRIDGPNNGSSACVAATVANNLAYRMDGLGLRVLVRADGESEPWCQGARLAQTTRIGDVWECRLSFGLPDKGALRVLAGTGAEPPRPAVDIRIGLPDKLRLRPQANEAGVTFLSGSSLAAFVYVRNRGQDVLEVRPLVRLDGDRLPYRPISDAGPFATAYRLRLQPGEEVPLEIDLSALRVCPGRRELQVYLKGWPAWAPVCHALEVEVTPPASVAQADLSR